MSMRTEPTPLIPAYEASNIDMMSGLRLVIVNVGVKVSVFDDDGEILKEASP